MVKKTDLINEVEHLSTSQLLSLFSTLKAPSISEMNGEYSATMLIQPNWLATLAGRALTNPFMSWQAKAFRPIDQNSGRGYNTFLVGSKIIQRYPMLTVLAPSRYDGQPAYQLVYQSFYSLCNAINMVDEVRQLDTGIYLGIGTWGFTAKQRQIAYPFLLQQNDQSYRGDIGRIRHGFQVTTREIPALNKVNQA